MPKSILSFSPVLFMAGSSWAVSASDRWGGAHSYFNDKGWSLTTWMVAAVILAILVGGLLILVKTSSKNRKNKP